MDQNRLVGIRDELRREEARLTAAVREERELIKQSELALEQVQSALAALGEKTAGRVRARKPAADKQEVAAAVAAVIDEHGAMGHEELKKQTENLVTRNGRSLQGFALRFREALQESRFVDSPEGVRLAAEHVSRDTPETNSQQ